MKVAYVDTSCLVAVLLGEPGGREMARRLKSQDELVAANLLEAELRSVLAREGVTTDAMALGVSWIVPDRPLSAEIARVLAAGSVRGADCWHLAAALYLAPDPSELTFLTLDRRQRDVALAVGFRT